MSIWRVRKARFSIMRVVEKEVAIYIRCGAPRFSLMVTDYFGPFSSRPP